MRTEMLKNVIHMLQDVPIDHSTIHRYHLVTSNTVEVRSFEVWNLLVLANQARKYAEVSDSAKTFLPLVTLLDVPHLIRNQDISQ